VFHLAPHLIILAVWWTRRRTTVCHGELECFALSVTVCLEETSLSGPEVAQTELNLCGLVNGSLPSKWRKRLYSGVGGVTGGFGLKGDRARTLSSMVPWTPNKAQHRKLGD